MNTIIISTIDIQRTCAADEQLALGIERTLVTVVSRGAVSQFISACHDEEGFFLALDVDGGAALVGDIHAIQVQLEVCLAVDGQRAVCCGAGHHVADA